MVNIPKLFSKTKNLSLLIVEDYEPLREDLSEMLADLFKVVVAQSDGKEALKSYSDYHKDHQKYFDLVISDIQMPKMDGVELCKSLRYINPNQMIIILSAHTEKEYLLELINLGISQFITKPFEHDEFLNTLCSITEKFDPSQEQKPDSHTVYLAEDFSWDTKKDLLSVKNEPVALTRYEIMLMRFLVLREGAICSNQDILEYLYNHNIDISDKSIRNLVFKLRKKLPETSITSLYGVGYKLNTI